MALKLNLLAPSGALWKGFGNALESLSTTCELANKLGTILRQLFGNPSELVSNFWLERTSALQAAYGNFQLLDCNKFMCCFNARTLFLCTEISHDKHNKVCLEQTLHYLQTSRGIHFNLLDSTILVMCTNILQFQLDLGTLSSEREYVLVLFDPGLSVSAMKRLPCNIIKHNLW